MKKTKLSREEEAEIDRLINRALVEYDYEVLSLIALMLLCFVIYILTRDYKPIRI